jgi:hypothetical protein
MTHTYYIVESPTLGTLKDMEFEYDGKPKPRYSVSGARTDNAILYSKLKDAVLARDMLRHAKARGHKTLTIVRTSDFRTLCDECGGWIDYSYGNPKGHDEQCTVWRKWLHDRTH